MHQTTQHTHVIAWNAGRTPEKCPRIYTIYISAPGTPAKSDRMQEQVTQNTEPLSKSRSPETRPGSHKTYPESWKHIQNPGKVTQNTRSTDLSSWGLNLHSIAPIAQILKPKDPGSAMWNLRLVIWTLEPVAWKVDLGC